MFYLLRVAGVVAIAKLTCCIDFEPYSWSHFVSTNRNHCCAFFDKFLTATSNAKPQIAFRGLRLCFLSPLNHQHLTPIIIANLCTECDISGGTVLVALLAASRIKKCGCFRVVDYCSPGFVKEVVYFTKVVTKTGSTTMCPRILDKEIFLLPLTLTGSTKIVSVLGL